MTTTKLIKKAALPALAFGLLAACGDDNSVTTVQASSDIQDLASQVGSNATVDENNACLLAGYTGIYAEDGVTLMCYDAQGNLSYWINADGTFGLPSDNQQIGPCGDLDEFIDESTGTTYCSSNGAIQFIVAVDGSITNVVESSSSTNPIESSAEVATTPKPEEISSSSIAQTTCNDASGPVNPNTIISGTDGSTYMYNDNCEVIVLSKPVTSSSSVSSESSSSITTTPTVSNGSEPSIAFSNSGATVTNDNGCVTVEESNVTITCGGNYFFSGSNSNGQIKVLAGSQDNVYLFMNSLTLGNTTTAPVVSLNSNKTFIVANEGTSTFTDASTRNSVINFTNASGAADTTYAGGCIFSKDDLTIKGTGTIKVTGNYNNGIHSSDDLRVRDNPTITVTAKNNAFKGKDLVDIEGGTLNLTATSGDGIKSDECTVNGKDTTITEGKGIVNIKGGTINIEKAGDDGIQAFNYVFINDSVSAPKITVKSTGKGIVSQDRIYINAGNIDVTSTDDGIHSNLNIYMNGGNVTVSSGDDGIHADSTLRLAGSTINITKASEGMEAFYIRAEGGITATYGTDDGWNAAGGSADGSTSSGSQWGGPGGMGGMQSSSKGYIIISGGYHYISASGNDIDVLDANGTATQTGGVVILEIPTSSGGSMGGGMGGGRPGQGGSSSGGCSTNMAGGLIDTDNGFSITGGVLLGFGNQTEEYPNCSSTSYTAGTAYGSANAAFAPKGSGSMILYGGSVGSVAQVNTSGMSTVEFPNGLKYYYK